MAISTDVLSKVIVGILETVITVGMATNSTDQCASVADPFETQSASELNSYLSGCKTISAVLSFAYGTIQIYLRLVPDFLFAFVTFRIPGNTVRQYI
jgi:hypothetical protein